MAETTTPLMKQYHAIKAQHPNTVLLYRMGDFYEMFNEDAEIASKVLGITLTSRNHGDAAGKTPLAGFPYHALDRYSARLVKAGYKIAICEQTEDPKLAKGVVKRDVIEVVTAGTSLDPNFLEQGKNNFLVAVVPSDHEVGLAALDLSTGEFTLAQVPQSVAIDELARLAPAEVLVPETLRGNHWPNRITRDLRTVVTFYDDWRFASNHAAKTLTEHFRVATLDGFGCAHLPLAVSAAGASLTYVKQQKKIEIFHLQGLRVQHQDQDMLLDAATQRNLELLRTADGDDVGGTLLSVIDRTQTAMGARMLRRWIIRPLRDVQAIQQRLDAVEQLIRHSNQRREISIGLRKISDIERIVGRVGTQRAHARDLCALKDSLEELPTLCRNLHALRNPLLSSIVTSLKGFDDLVALLAGALTNEPPLSLREGNLIRQGHSRDLDQLKSESKGGKEWIANLQPRERERTGINSLKVGFNKVFGYYIEVSKSNLNLVPQDYVRKQTLTNGERFITPELKDWEVKVLGAEEKIKNLEYDLFVALRTQVGQWNQQLQKAANGIAALDVLLSLADTAERMCYAKPTVNNSTSIWIEEGRHPVVEFLNPSEPFTPNDVIMDNEKQQILLITGPNMAGKSTYLRQVALIVLLAQMGSFVPAKNATIGVVDRIFTRVGASDKLAKGQSTFLVEMTEVANILRNATRRSLILLDEVGRGTSTFDGLSIAWAVAEHLHENQKVAAKTLFATHYHELAELAGMLPRIKNYNVQVKEWNDQVIFLRCIVEGSCDHSYGIEVARLAGVPQEVITRAKEILANLESMATTPDHKPALALHKGKSPDRVSDMQMNLFQAPAVPPSHAEAIDKLKNTDVNDMTPLQALQKLSEIKALLDRDTPATS